MAALTRRQYPEEFKQEAVRLVRDSARPVAQVFYNRPRRHSALNYDSPAEFEARAAVA